MKTHHELDVWNRSISFVTEIYKITDRFPKHELFVLTAQIRRAAISVPSNIAEGAGRRHHAELRQFINIAIGSLSEIETQLIISKNLNYLEQADLDSLLDERSIIARQLQSLHNSLNKHNL